MFSCSLLLLITFPLLPREVLSSQRHLTSLPRYGISLCYLPPQPLAMLPDADNPGYDTARCLPLSLNSAHATHHSINTIPHLLLLFEPHFLYTFPCYHHPCLKTDSSTLNAYILVFVASFQISSYDPILHLQNISLVISKTFHSCGFL